MFRHVLFYIKFGLIGAQFQCFKNIWYLSIAVMLKVN